MTQAIPLIDLTPWFEGTDAGRVAVVDAVRGACETSGFFVIAGHGVDPDVIARMYAASRAFFDLPQEERAAVPPVGEVPGGLMHFGYGSENLAATLGAVTPPDRKETLDYGPLYRGAPWPARPAGLQDAWIGYYAALDQLCATLRCILARAARLPDKYFEPYFEHALSSLRAIDYPEPDGPALPGQLRAGAHTDYGFLTVLLSEDKPGGLEVMDLHGNWIAPKTPVGTFVVNLGDSLMRWTDDLWRSTPHRVVNPPVDAAGGTRRQSIPFFHNPGRDALIDTLPTFRKAGVAAKYPPITYGDYSLDRQSKSHGDHINKVV